MGAWQGAKIERHHWIFLPIFYSWFSTTEVILSRDLQIYAIQLPQILGVKSNKYSHSSSNQIKPKRNSHPKSMGFLTYLIGFSVLAGASILYCRAVVLLVVRTPISLLATFSLWTITIWKNKRLRLTLVHKGSLKKKKKTSLANSVCSLCVLEIYIIYITFLNFFSLITYITVSQPLFLI